MRDYKLVPHSPVGAVVTGLDLRSDFSSSIFKKLAKDVHKHKILIFRDQDVLSGDQQIEISRHFGEIETAGFDHHPMSPDRLILRVSNDAEEGFRDFGTKGFHVDGSFMPNPNAYSIYHTVITPPEVETWFVSLNDVYSRLSKEQQNKWDRLWMVKRFDCIRGFRDQPGKVIHPLVYYHPVTGKKTLCIAQGKTSGFIYDYGSPNEVRASNEDTKAIFQEIDSTIYADDHSHIYKHKWKHGDFVISDNLAVGHMAGSSTQSSPNDVGLRVMHRTIIRGKTRPSKEKPPKNNFCNCLKT